MHNEPNDSSIANAAVELTSLVRLGNHVAFVEESLTGIFFFASEPIYDFT